MDALLWELLEQGNPDDWVEILIKFDDWEKLASENLYSAACIGNIRSCRIRRGDIVEVRNNDAVISMKADRDLFLEPPLDEQQQSIHGENRLNEIARRRPDIAQTGEGVVMGIADWGFDYNHCNFIDANGNTRFLAIWDQGAPYDGTNIYGFGRIYYRNEIDDALSTDAPFEALGYHPGRNDLYQQGMHGTHVLDIAAGNGSIGDSGVAPGADLIAVHLATGAPRDLLGLGTSVRVFDAIHFINDLAGDRPLVINMSVGSHTEAHLGKSLVEQAIDHLVTSSPGRCVVQSCGNYFSSRVHTEGQLEKGKRTFLEWLVSNEDQTSNLIEIWYHAEDEIRISLQRDNAEYKLRDMGLGMAKVINSQQQEIGRYYHRSHEPNTGLNHIVIILEANAGFGKWKVWLNPVSIVNGRFHSWIERDHGNVSNQSRFSLQQSVTSCTTGSICNGFYNICVGAVNTQDNRNNIAFFSSSGPTVDNRQKPDLVAPGVGILAAKSASMDQRRSECELTHKTGTSMAAPVVAGAIALLYEAFGKGLTIAEIKSKLKAACSLPDTNDPGELQRYGYGILDIEKLFTTNRPSRTVLQRPLPKIKVMDNSYDTPESIESLVEDAENRFPRLRDGDICKFFDALPIQKVFLGGIGRGDLLLRRQYGHHKRARWFIIDGVDGNELSVADRSGTKTFRILNPGRYLDKEWKLIKSFKNRLTASGSPGVLPGYEEDSFFGEAPSPATPPAPTLKWTCGYSSPIKVMSENNVRTEIANVAWSEKAFWVKPAAGTTPAAVKEEFDISVFGKLVQYWLAEHADISAADFVQVTNNAIASTVNYATLHAFPKTTSETSDPFTDEVEAIATTLITGVTSTTVKGKVKTAVIKAWRSRHDVAGAPWSAVFIVYCVRMAGIRLGLVTTKGLASEVLLKAGTGHRIYVLEAFKRRFGTTAERKSDAYHAYDPIAKPDIGDIIVTHRKETDIKNIVKFCEIPSRLDDGITLHGDIVVKVNTNDVETIGGNLAKPGTDDFGSVRRRRYPIDSRGCLIIHPHQLYTVEADDLSLAGVPVLNNSSALHKDSTARIFTVLRVHDHCSVT